jgi:hypothetical protein
MTENNPFVVDSEDSPYMKHHFQEKTFYRGKEAIDVSHFMIDPATMLMGFGKYDTVNGYSYVWGKDLFSKVDKPDEDYKKAFSVWVLPKYINGDQNITHAPSLWQRNSYGEYTGFQQIGNLIWQGLKENEGKLPIVKWVGSESINIGMGSTSIPKFELSGWQQRPESFVIPTWHTSEDDSSSQSPNTLTETTSSDSISLNDEIPF